MAAVKEYSTLVSPVSIHWYPSSKLETSVILLRRLEKFKEIIPLCKMHTK